MMLPLNLQNVLPNNSNEDLNGNLAQPKVVSQRGNSKLTAKSAATDAFAAVQERLSKIQEGNIGSYNNGGNQEEEKAKLIVRSKGKGQLTKVPKNPYFRLGRDTTAVDNYSEGESGSEFPVKYKSLK